MKYSIVLVLVLSACFSRDEGASKESPKQPITNYSPPSTPKPSPSVTHYSEANIKEALAKFSKVPLAKEMKVLQYACDQGAKGLPWVKKIYDGFKKAEVFHSSEK